MSRYIDADALIEGIANKFYDEASTAEAFDMVNKVCDYITDAPSIDIVRCKECRYCHRNYVDMTPSYQHDYCYKFSRYMNADDFCSYGERNEP